jgi:hypothetical protein
MIGPVFGPYPELKGFKKEPTSPEYNDEEII